MTTLSGSKVKDIYGQLLKVGSGNTGLTASLQYIEDGQGDQSPMQVSTTAVSIDSLTCTSGLTVTGNITVSGTVDGRDIATDGTKLDGIEASADVTDETNVKAALDGATITAATVAASDKILGQDVDDSDNLKTYTASSIANTATSLATSVIDSGTFADARIAESNITQHQTAINNAVDDATMTLTNKTFDANGTGNSLSNVDVADLATGTDGELITWDSSGNPTTVAVGTSGQILTSNGAGAAPTFQSGGGLVHISTVTASNSSTVDLDNVMDGTYDCYIVKCTALIPATDGAEIRARLGTGATPTYQSGAADYLEFQTTQSYLNLNTVAGIGNDTGEHANFTVQINDPSNTSIYTLVFVDDLSFIDTAGDQRAQTPSAGAYTSTTAVTSIQFFADSGNITSGNFSIYGFSNS